MMRWAALSFLVATALLWGLRPVSKHNQDQLVLGCYSAPRNLDHDYFQLLTELGFNHSLYWSSPRIDPEQWKSDLDRADKRNIHLIFNSGQPAAMPEEWLAAISHRWDLKVILAALFGIKRLTRTTSKPNGGGPYENRV